MNAVFFASLDQLKEMLQFIRSFIHQLDFKNTTSSNIELAMEEALVNIIKHGYPSQKGTIEINCAQLSDRKGIKIIIKDFGIPYNPIEKVPPINLKSSLESRSVGGYGVHLIRQIMDELDYQRTSDSNILTLVKYQ